MEFSEILKELRINLGITQKKLALDCNLSPQCINQLEAGTRKPTGSTLVALSDFFDCSIDYLMGREPNLEDSIFSAPSVPMPQNEKKLLTAFKRLPPDLQVRAIAYVQGLDDAINGPARKYSPGK